jgi:flagellar biosynthesis protein FlhA
VIGGLLLRVGWALRRADARRARTRGRPAPRPPSRVAPRDAALEALPIDPLELAIGFGLVPLVDQARAARCSRASARSAARSPPSSGMVIPPCASTTSSGLDSHEYVLKVRGTEVARGRIMAGHQLALDPGDAVGQLNAACRRPSRRSPARRVDPGRPAREARRSGTPWSIPSRSS